MFTLVFLLCNSVTCMSASPPPTFLSRDECEQEGYAMIEEGKHQVESGEVPPHAAVFQCVSWGTPA